MISKKLCSKHKKSEKINTIKNEFIKLGFSDEYFEFLFTIVKKHKKNHKINTFNKTISNN